uniref:protein-serine/threonine phosphatase n=1 Tax=Aegilops tauschii TaxID=37682 RepID=M8BE96_AEGTA
MGFDEFLKVNLQVLPINARPMDQDLCLKMCTLALIGSSISTLVLGVPRPPFTVEQGSLGSFLSGLCWLLPYITCKPFLRHHCLGPRDKFLILASDGLYEYFTNEEVVGHVEAFTSRFPDEDPAKYLSHEILLHAARQAGMGLHELLEVRQGDQRQYHDDVSIIIISLKGKIWRSSA